MVQFERQLANISVPEVIRIDTSAIYHKITIQKLTELVPQIKWMTYFSELVSPMKINETEAIVSYSMDFFLALGKVLEKTEKRVVRNSSDGSGMYLKPRFRVLEVPWRNGFKAI